MTNCDSDILTQYTQTNNTLPKRKSPFTLSKGVKCQFQDNWQKKWKSILSTPYKTDRSHSPNPTVSRVGCVNGSVGCLARRFGGRTEELNKKDFNSIGVLVLVLFRFRVQRIGCRWWWLVRIMVVFFGFYLLWLVVGSMDCFSWVFSSL